MRKEVISILLIVLLFTPIVLTTTNKVYGKDDNEEDELEEEIREKDEAGDHWLGGITPDEDPDADKESDLGYNEYVTIKVDNRKLINVNSMIMKKKENLKKNYLV